MTRKRSSATSTTAHLRATLVVAAGLLAMVVCGAGTTATTPPAYGSDRGERDSLRTSAAQVTLLADLNPGPASSVAFPSDLMRANGLVFVSAFSPGVGMEPWVSDGTPSGTRLVADFVPGPRSSSLRHVTSTARGTLLAVDNSGEDPDGPWTGSLWTTTSTGDTAGETTLLLSGPMLSTDAVRFGDDALLHLSDFGNVGAQLWRSDGTPGGTHLVKGGLTLGINLTPAGKKVFFTNAQNPLMVTDGTTAGTRRVRGWPDGPQGSTLVLRISAVDGRAFLHVNSLHGVGAEMWVSNGTRAGTRLLKDINPGPASALPDQLTPLTGRMYFVADDGRRDVEVWRSDGTSAGTVRVTDVPTPGVRNLTACRGRLYFTTADKDRATLWTSSGRVGHQRPVARMPGNRKVPPLKLTCLPGGLTFTANDGVHGRELWTLEQGARRPVLHDVAAGARSSRPFDLTRAGASVVFSADDRTHGREIWAVTF